MNAETDEVHWSPSTTLVDLLHELIDAATHSIDLAMFRIDLEVFGPPLVQALERGVRVRCLIDQRSIPDVNGEPAASVAELLSDRGATVCVHRSRERLFHHKVVLVDDRLLTSSGNWCEPHFTATIDHWLLSADDELVGATRRWFEQIHPTDATARAGRPVRSPRGFLPWSVALEHRTPSATRQRRRLAGLSRRRLLAAALALSAVANLTAIVSRVAW